MGGAMAWSCLICRSWSREGCLGDPEHRDHVLWACHQLEAGVGPPLVLVPTDWERELLHAARVAHRARIWTHDEVRLLTDLHVDVQGARAVAEARLVFRAKIRQIMYLRPGDSVGMRQGQLVHLDVRAPRH
jgi:hypothetical protein